MSSIDHSANSGFEPRIGRSVSLDHAATMLGVSRRTIYNRIREGRLQTIRTLGGSQRVLLDSVSENRARAAGYAEAPPLGDRRQTLGGGSSV
jgi:excisionase family DNA binding protein